jgi:hypothetical protein
MSDTIELPCIRFIRQAMAGPASNVTWLATLASAVDRLKAEPWRQADPDAAPALPTSNPEASFFSDAFDAFKASGDAAPQSGVQAAYCGMALYRFTLPADASAGDPAALVSARITAYGDKFNWRGLLLSAWLSDSPVPLDAWDWDWLRGEAAGFDGARSAIDGDGNGVCAEPAPASKDARNRSQAADLAWPAPASVAGSAYVYVAVQLAGWLDNRWEYWIEGAGMIDGPAAEFTFSRDVEPDAQADAGAVILVTDGILRPLAAPPADAPPEAVSAELGIERGAAGAEDGAVAWHRLAALMAAEGAPQLPPSALRPGPAAGRFGLACSLSHGEGSPTAPLTSRLVYLASPVAFPCAWPARFAPRRLVLTARPGAALAVAGAVVSLSVYWVAARLLTPAQAGLLAGRPDALFGAGSVALGDAAAALIGRAALPETLPAGASFAVPLSPQPGRWGTLVAVPRIERLAVPSLMPGAAAGIAASLRIAGGALSGSGWIPDFKITK